jgi:hypothetical protein
VIRLVFKTLSGARDITRGENLRRDQIVSMQIETLRHGVAERADDSHHLRAPTPPPTMSLTTLATSMRPAFGFSPTVSSKMGRVLTLY